MKEIVGHQRQWRFLQQGFRNSRVSHAYLFSGIDSIGKKTLAIEFVKLLNCKAPEVEKRPCDVCASCEMINRAIYPDLFYVKPELNKGAKEEIRIAKIRELLEKLSLKPIFAEYKSAIIDSAHLMNRQTQNCILKTLEEPKGKTVIILVTGNKEALLNTILSRVQEIKFFPAPKAEIKKFLKKQKHISQTQIQEIMDLSMGRVGKALEYLQDPAGLSAENARVDKFIELLDADINARFSYIESLSKGPFEDSLKSWLRYSREHLLVHLGKEGEIKFRKIIKGLEKTIYLLSQTNINKRLALESLMLNI